MIPGIRTAETLWMEAGGMSGPPDHRHQIEFSNDVAEFFDDSARENEVIEMGLQGGPLHMRPLTYRGTDYGQWTDIWRLGLLTPRMGGPQYAGRVIRIDRIKAEHATVYKLQVVDAGSAEAAQWRTRSSHVDVTGGPQGREFGIW